jgi:orotidine-5'-phosphate decarboxylase
MPEVTFSDKLAMAIRQKQSILCVGLDPQLDYMPESLIREWQFGDHKTFEYIAGLFLDFNRQIIDAVAPCAVAVKPQIAFYEQYGSAGLATLESTLDYAREKGLIDITDAKRGDGGDTANAYADGHIGEVLAWEGGRSDEINLVRKPSPIRTDAVTIHVQIGDDCVMRFVERVKQYGTGIFVVDKTSFKPNSRVEQIATTSGLKVWQEIALMTKTWGEGTEAACGYRNVGVVMGATYPADALWMRDTLPNSWFLVPGYGGQGGTADQAVTGVNHDGLGCVVNSSRGITYAYQKGQFQTDPAKFAEAAGKAAEFSRNELNEALKRAGKLAF